MLNIFLIVLISIKKIINYNLYFEQKSVSNLSTSLKLIFKKHLTLINSNYETNKIRVRDNSTNITCEMTLDDKD